jgi:hypothetical protein
MSAIKAAIWTAYVTAICTAILCTKWSTVSTAYGTALNAAV